jgi:transposase-like protein
VVVLTGLRSKHFVALVNRLSALPLAPHAPRPDGPARAFRFSAEQIAAIVQAYEAGATMASLAGQHDVKRQSIAALLKREGTSIRPRKIFSPAQIDEAVTLYGTGHSAATIADRFGFDTATIWRALRKRGVQTRSPNDWQY